MSQPLPTPFGTSQTISSILQTLVLAGLLARWAQLLAVHPKLAIVWVTLARMAPDLGHLLVVCFVSGALFAVLLATLIGYRFGELQFGWVPT